MIHQPRLAVYEEFTHLLLLGKGGKQVLPFPPRPTQSEVRAQTHITAYPQVFCGRGELIEEYFTKLGFRLPDRENPADWLIDVVCGLAPRYKEDGTVDDEFTAPQAAACPRVTTILH